MTKRLLKIEDCHFSFPDEHGNYYPITIKNSKVYCGKHWKEIKIYDDSGTDLINVCETLVNFVSKQNEG